MKGKAKKPYKKPQIKQVNLVPEEATLEFCKDPGGATGQGANACLNPGAAQCKSPGT